MKKRQAGKDRITERSVKITREKNREKKKNMKNRKKKMKRKRIKQQQLSYGLQRTTHTCWARTGDRGKQLV
jgi:hypothetical protein